MKIYTRWPFLEVLSHRSFFYLWVIQILSQFASNITLFLLGLILYKQTGSNTAVSGLFMAYGVPSVIFGMVAGTFVDKIDKRLIIFWTNAIRALLVFGLLFVSGNIVVLYLLMFVNALVSQFFVPAEASMIPKLVPEQKLVSANSLFSFAYYSSMAIGFIIAGPLLRLTGPYWSLGILSALFAVTSIVSLKLPHLEEKDSNMKKILTVDIKILTEKMWTSLSDGVSYVWQSKVLLDSVLLLTGTQIIIVMLGTLGPGFADRIMGIDVGDASLIIIGPVVVGILLGSMWVGNIGYKRYSDKKLIQWGIIGAGTLLVIISGTVYVVRFAGMSWLYTNMIIIPLEIVLFFFLGFCNSLLDVPANSILQKTAEGDMRGRVYGVLAAFVGGVGILPVMAGGILADFIGVGKVIFTLGVCIAGYGLFRYRYSHRT